jgi:hypothetical protein
MEQTMPIILAIVLTITWIQTQPDEPATNLYRNGGTLTITGEPMHTRPLGWSNAGGDVWQRYDPNRQHFKR